MLTREENELLVRVGQATPMGALLREYWMPAARSESLLADGAPLRVRILGENLVAFRATDGRVGLFDEGCPHRCTSLALARNEDNALTCIFHGWKIDVSGKVVEVPSEPPERRAEFAAKVRVRHYPVREAGGAVWVYLGRNQQPPRFFDFEFTALPASQVACSKAILHCNWLQAIETTIDSSHLGVLHASWLNLGNNGNAIASANNGPHYDYLMAPYGFREAALRELPDGSVYQRIREVVAPFYSFVPAHSERPQLMICAVPIDDQWTSLWYWEYDRTRPLAGQFLFSRANADNWDNTAARLGAPEQVWNQDRKALKEGHWTGMPSLTFEDFVVAEAPGPIADRTREYLGSSDSTPIRFRRMMLNAARAFARGEPPLGQSEPVDYRKIRAVALRAPRELDWRAVDPMQPPQSLPMGPG
jgi:phthalate 4,5-dioxygenase oxygenase subunit